MYKNVITLLQLEANELKYCWEAKYTILWNNEHGMIVRIN